MSSSLDSTTASKSGVFAVPRGPYPERAAGDEFSTFPCATPLNVACGAQQLTRAVYDCMVKAPIGSYGVGGRLQ